MLSFGKKNAKLGKIATFSLPAGYSCPFSDRCLSKANKETGKIKDGKNTEFRCFSASAEALYPNVRKSRWNNYDSLKGKSIAQMVSLIQEALPKKKNVVRIHVSGDFFSYDYFLSWIEVAKLNPDKLFYAYTKSISYWLTFGPENLPSNLVLTASYGGKEDKLIAENNLRSATVVYSEKEAENLGLPIDHDDSLAKNKDCKKFALLIHGIQPKGKMQPNKKWGYGPKVPLQLV